MALIGKIREKSWLLILIIGLALVAFILSDYKSIMGGYSDQYGLGTVYGTKVNGQKYEVAVQNSQRQIYFNQVNQTGNRDYQLTQEDQDNANEQAWNALVLEELIEPEINELGIEVSENELKSFILGKDGFEPIPQLTERFKENGVLNNKKLEEYYFKKKSNKQESESIEQEKKEIQNFRLKSKFFGLITQGIYVTSLEAEDEYYAQKESKSISVVVKKFSELNDAEFKVTDAELKDFYEKHKEDKKYVIQESNREVKVMDFVVVPSKKDSIEINKKMDALKKGLAKTKNDSLFVTKNSDLTWKDVFNSNQYNNLKFYSSSKIATVLPEDNQKANKFLSYPREYDTIFKSALIGDIVGPYFSNGNIVVSKVIGFTPSRLKARHILIGTNQSTDSTVLKQKKTLADSLLKLINKDNFEEFAKKHSTDEGTKDKGGQLEEFLERDLVKEFGEFCASKPIGTIGIVKSQYGFHIIEVQERDDLKFPVLALVSKNFKSSQETTDERENEAYTFIEELDKKLNAVEDLYKRSVLFDTLVSQKKKTVRLISIYDNKPAVQGYNTSFVEDKILKFVYDSKAVAGMILTTPIKDKDKYIVAYLSSIKKKGTPTYDDVKASMEKELIEEKKFKRVANQLSVDKTLEDMARRANVQIVKAEVTFGNPQIANVGFEPEVVGAIFSGVKDGQRTKAIKGKSGIFIVRVDATKKAPATASFKIEKDQLLATLKGSVQNQLILALTKKAEVIDNRKFNRLGIIRE